jgi:hypothetical protein
VARELAELEEELSEMQVALLMNQKLADGAAQLDGLQKQWIALDADSRETRVLVQKAASKVQLLELSLKQQGLGGGPELERAVFDAMAKDLLEEEQREGRGQGMGLWDRERQQREQARRVSELRAQVEQEERRQRAQQQGQQQRGQQNLLREKLQLARQENSLREKLQQARQRQEQQEQLQRQQEQQRREQQQRQQQQRQQQQQQLQRQVQQRQQQRQQQQQLPQLCSSPYRARSKLLLLRRISAARSGLRLSTSTL